MITVTSDVEAVSKLVQQWPARARALMRMTAYMAARGVYRGVKAKIPAQHGELRKAIRLSRIVGLPDSAQGYAVHAIAKGRSIPTSDEPTTVMYVSAKTNLMTKVPRSVRILEEHGPWTVDTLPYQPDLKFATVVSRKANPRTVAKVRRMRHRDRAVWRRKMNDAGLREIRKGARLQANRRMKSVPDVAFESVRLEFGLGGAASHPHWRPAILKLAVRGLTGMIARNPQFSKAMNDPSYSGWMSWPPPVSTRVTTMQVLTYVPFQRKLGIRVKR